MEIDLTLLALLITSIATVVYATLTFFLLLETKREKKKPIIEEILGVVLDPIRQLLFDEVADFKKGDARLLFSRNHFRANGLINTTYSYEPDALVFQDFRKNNPEIAEMIDKHDIYTSELVGLADKITEKLYTPDFKKKCDELVIKWEESGHQKISNIYSGSHLIYEDILSYLVNNIEKLDERHLVYEFWKVNHEIFFKEKNRLAGEQSKNLEYKLKDFEIFSKNFLKKVEKLIEIYQMRYNIAAKFITQKYELYQKGFL